MPSYALSAPIPTITWSLLRLGEDKKIMLAKLVVSHHGKALLGDLERLDKMVSRTESLRQELLLFNRVGKSVVPSRDVLLSYYLKYSNGRRRFFYYSYLVCNFKLW